MPRQTGHSRQFARSSVIVLSCRLFQHSISVFSILSEVRPHAAARCLDRNCIHRKARPTGPLFSFRCPSGALPERRTHRPHRHLPLASRGPFFMSALSRRPIGPASKQPLGPLLPPVQ
ncbi:hypothetical protein B9Z07_17555 [Burkholderia cenocepacia]|uniref:Uncharacterized protein n=1 Tax=Burkholderia cenocepacia TaxID=95486 RepID=A0AAD0J271_9BURK|nr:hypothetical protein B9Z07_17555 [Burkholderia cenocepacia]PRE32339.1 hypothetical protein C6P63_32475 [Burkholderia cenocepacia]